jgi:hypothetical protein
MMNEARLTSHRRKPLGHQLCPLSFGNRPLVQDITSLGFGAPLVPHSYKTVLYLTYLTTRIVYFRNFGILSYTPVFGGPAVGFDASPGSITYNTSQGDPAANKSKTNKRKQRKQYPLDP